MARTNAKAPIVSALVQTVFFVSLAWTTCFLAWVSLRLVDFGYPLLYSALDIDGHIARYGPRNEFKAGFEQTGREQRVALFAAIVDAVHADGRGLRQLRYRDATGREQALLREPEVVHLESVARLIGRLKTASWCMLALLAAALAAMRRMALAPPRLRRVAAVSAAVLLGGTALVFALGPENVFNTLHVWIFPPDEQWFFYYEESLMTTLMKAPDLFGAIAVLLLLAALAYGGLLLLASWRWLSPGSRPAPR